MTQAANLAALGSYATSTGKAAFPGGVLQVVNVVMSTVFTTTGNGVAITGASLSITPSASTSKILVIATGSVNKGGGGDALIYLARNGTPIGNGTGGSQLNGFVDTSQSYGYLISAGATTVLDTPATTSAVTYALYVANNNSNTVYVNGRGSPTDFGMPCTITAIEIAG
jgi:hypothetical protein